MDISGSMRGSKIKNAKKAAKIVVDALKPSDTVAVTIFSDQARTVVPSQKAIDKYSIMAAIDRISIVGGTRLYHGLEVASREMKKGISGNSINRMIVLTDGETEGEEQCVTIARQERANKISITAFGVGDEYNEEFLREVSDITLGGFYHIKDPEFTANSFRKELADISAAVITDVKVSLNLVGDVKFDQFHMIFPHITLMQPEIENEGNIIMVQAGNLHKNEQSVFGVHLKLPLRQAGRVRIAQVFASYNIPSLDITDRVVKQDVVVEYTPSKDRCGKVDKEVITYFNQLSVRSMLEKAMKETKSGNVVGATESLNQAKQFTQRIGNIPLTRDIDDALEELRQKGVISAGTIKTVRSGSSQTVRIDEEEE
jgi:Ca-activated chloride channel family protein